MGVMKQYLLEQAEREAAEQYCKECDGAIGMDWEDGGCTCDPSDKKKA